MECRPTCRRQADRIDVTDLLRDDLREQIKYAFINYMSHVQKKRRNDIALFRLVYAELEANAPDDVSPRELLLAAQTLIEITDEEYGLERYKERGWVANYFSREVDRFITNGGWALALSERRLDNDCDVRVESDLKAMEVLRMLNGGSSLLEKD